MSGEKWNQEAWALRVFEAKCSIPKNATDDPIMEWDKWIIRADAELASLRFRVAELEYQNKQLEEYVLKGVAFRDELQSRVAALEKENGRLREAVELLCRETLGAIINATTIVQVEKLSGDVVKEAHAKGELLSLRLLESWLDRNVPKTIAALRRRAGQEGG